MSDLLIKGLKLPASGNELRLIIHPNGQTIVSNYTYWEEAEAIEVPDHGRLIDADALAVEFIKAQNSYDDHGRPFSYSFMDGGEICAEWWAVEHIVDNAPTIIPESGEEAAT